MANFMVTGSSGGLGLELVREISRDFKRENTVIAAARNCSPALMNIIRETGGRVKFIHIDISDVNSVTKSIGLVVDALQGKGLDVLINCASVCRNTTEIVKMLDLDFHFSVNVIGTHNVIRSFIPLLQKGKSKKIVNISSAYASISNAAASSEAPCPAYKISKSALNALTIQYALAFQNQGLIFMAVHPGWLRTNMGGQNADLKPEEGAQAVLKIVINADRESNGRFRNIEIPGSDYDGKDIPW